MFLLSIIPLVLQEDALEAGEGQHEAEPDVDVIVAHCRAVRELSGEVDVQEAGRQGRKEEGHGEKAEHLLLQVPPHVEVL